MDLDTVSSCSSDTTLPFTSKPARSKISAIDKNRIIDAYQNGHKIKLIASLFHINESTIRNILCRYNKSGSIASGKIGGYKKKIINPEIGDILLDEIDQHPDITLEEMKTFLSSKQCNVSISTISNFLKGRFYTFKKLKYSNIEKNSERVKESRNQYVDNILRNCIRSSQCIYIDETYCNIWTQKLKGKAARGEPAYLEVPSQRGPNISILMAISKKGPIYYEIHQGSVTQPIYQQFLMGVSLRLCHSTEHYLIHDNASIHNGVLSTTENHKILRLPPYSPFLNPIENYFSKIKSKLRKKLTSFDFASSTLSKFQIINEAIAEIIQMEQDINLSPYFNNIKKYYPDCLKHNNIY